MSLRYKDYYKNHYKSSFTEADISEWLKWFYTQWRFINKKIKLKKNMRILEIGPGFGGFYKVLQEQLGEPDYLGLDLDPDIVKFTNDYFNTKSFRYQSVEDLKDKERFDMVVAFEVLEHVDNPGEVVNKVFALLKPKGVFCATTPYPFKRNIVSDATHISVLHPENWNRLFAMAGFKRVESYPMSFAPFFWRLAKRINIRIPYYLPIKGFVSTNLIIARKK